MGALSDRWNVFKAALGTRSYGLADFGKLGAIVLAAIALAWFGYEMSAMELGLAVALLVSIALFWIMLEYALKLTRQIADSRVQIAELRHKGVRLRNDALRDVVDEKTWKAWERKALSWNKKVTKEIGNISKADAVWFSVLDIVPLPRILPTAMPGDNEASEKFFKLFREHDYRLARLDEMIRDLWGRR